MPRYLLGIDNGSTLIKAALFDQGGNEIAVHSSPVEVRTPAPGRFERSLEEIWHANVEVISRVVEEAALDPGDILGLAFTGHGGGVHLVDDRGGGLYPAMEGVDTRARVCIQRWLSDGTFDRVHSKTLQNYFPAQMAPLLAWMKEKEPRILDKARWILPLKDYVRFRLTGEAWGEITNMSASGLLNVRDIRYDGEVLQELGLGGLEEKLPPLRRSADVCGKVTREAARLTGLKEGTPVAGGMWDVDAVAIATGVTDDTRLNIIAGTWGNNQFISTEPLVSKSLFMTTVFCIPGFWLILEGSPTSASNLEWFVKELMAAERGRCEREGLSVYELCNREVTATPAEEPAPVFLPFLYGSNAGTDAQAAFLGLNGQHKRGHLLRSVYEGVVFSHRTHLEKLKALRPLPDRARLAGGAAASEVWVQMFADILQLSIERIGAKELGALGGAITAGVACGAFASFQQGVEAMVHPSGRVDPDPRRAGIYERKYRRYRAAVDSLSGFWNIPC